MRQHLEEYCSAMKGANGFHIRGAIVYGFAQVVIANMSTEREGETERQYLFDWCPMISSLRDRQLQRPTQSIVGGNMIPGNEEFREYWKSIRSGVEMAACTRQFLSMGLILVEIIATAID
jgi:hypothetical protein